MSAADILAAAERNDTVRKWAVRVGLVLAGLLILYVARCDGVRKGQAEQKITASVQATKAAEVIREKITDTIRQVRTVVVRDSGLAVVARSAVQAAAAQAKRADFALAVILGASTIRVHDTVAVVPVEVVERFRADSAVIQRQAVALVADSVREVARIDETVHRIRQSAADSVERVSMATTIKLLESRSAPKCGAKCGAVIGVASTLAAGYLVGRVIR